MISSYICISMHICITPKISSCAKRHFKASGSSRPRGQEVAKDPAIQRHQVRLDEHGPQGVGKDLKEHEDGLNFANFQSQELKGKLHSSLNSKHPKIGLV